MPFQKGNQLHKLVKNHNRMFGDANPSRRPEAAKKISEAKKGKCSDKVREVSGERFRKYNLEHTGEKHYEWKGDDVGYRTLHKWVEKELGKPCHCEDCKNDKLNPRQYHWANISKNYNRITNDWRRLCVKCHKAYDRVKSD